MITKKRMLSTDSLSQSRRIKRSVRNACGDHRVRRIKALRTQLSSRFNVGPWRRPGLNGLDTRLADCLEWTESGTFIELGANDGLQQSNSFMLERELGWRGVLIEGIPELAAEALRNRPEATVVCAAVTVASNAGVIAMNDIDLVSSISGSEGTVWVATTTLSSVIDKVSKGEAPDLLSIDVEGFEMDVLQGLDLSRHRPRWILVETKHNDAVNNALAGYALQSRLSHHDYLYLDTSEAPGNVGG